MANLRVPIAKGGKDAYIDVDYDLIPTEQLTNVAINGLVTILNARMSKVGAITKLEGKALEDAKAMAMKIANENLESLMANRTKPKGKAAKSDHPREVMTEARRIAKEMVKNKLRAANRRISHVAASDITKAANMMIESDPSIIEKAREAIAERANLTNTMTSEIDVTSMVPEDPKKVAKAEKAKTDRRGQLSATQAGLVAPRQRPATHPVH